MKQEYLYFDISSEGVFRKPTDHYESFIPTVDLDEGWVVFVEYSIYDSYGPSPGTYHEVIDMCHDPEMARTQAIRIRDRRHSTSTITPPVKADGSKVYENWHHWGQKFEKVVLVKVIILDEKPITREEFS